MRKFNVILISIVLLLSFSTTIYSGVDKINEVLEIVNNAIDYIEHYGKFDVFNDPYNQEFIKDNIYVFVYEYKSPKEIILIAHPFLKNRLVGKNVAMLKDKYGKYFIVEICRNIEKHPNGWWTTYYWVNPNTGKFELKYTFAKKVPGTDYIVAAGFYKSDIEHITLKELNEHYLEPN